MKAKSVFCGLTAMLFMLLGIALTSCEADDADVPPANETFNLIPQDMPNEAGSAQENTSPTIFFTASAESIGVTSANVRLHLEVNEIEQQQYQVYGLLNLNQFSQYHKFIQREDAFHILFSTETTVNDFRFFDVMPNDAFFREGADGTERRYTVLNTLYILNELTPEIPFVVQGPWFGSIFAEQGFSFVDEDGTTRYFVLGLSGRTGLVYVGEF
jgi:hypothetical protein